MTINYNRFFDGKRKALTMSYDDGVHQDKRLIEIFRKYGIKGTFHINGGLFSRTDRIKKEELREVYQGFEVSAHGLTHQSLGITPNEQVVEEIMRDRAFLEDIFEVPIRGMSYPNGSSSGNVSNILSKLGIEYSREVGTTGLFDLPEDFLRWKGTCHHNQDLIKKGKEFINLPNKWPPRLMYVWGHSYEFDNDNNWHMIEEFCKIVSDKDDTWYATNIEIVDYIKAVRNLKFGAKLDMALNQSYTDVWIEVNGEVVKIPKGELVKF